MSLNPVSRQTEWAKRLRSPQARYETPVLLSAKQNRGFVIVAVRKQGDPGPLGHVAYSTGDASGHPTVRPVTATGWAPVDGHRSCR